MDARGRLAFLLLIAAQAAHSVEEYLFRLYDRLAPARMVSEAIGLDRAAGFAVTNSALVLFGLWCYVARVRPGHRAAMDRAQFLAWRAAFNAFVDCGQSDRPKADCVAGWRRDAAAFIPAGREAMVDSLAGHYLDSRLRAAPAERARYCPPAA